ncbi:MAG: PorT family protein [Bacteroidales bacterium]|nr:PorT family protein [Bacteroidales bacterium]
MNKILKRLILALCLATGLNALAAEPDLQQRPHDPEGDVPLYDSTRPEKWIEFQPHVSVGLSTIVQDYGSKIPGLSDFMLSPGCRMNLGLDIRFCIRNSFALATGLEFNINNFRYSMSIVDTSSGSISSIYTRNHYYSLTVPVYLSWRLNIGRRMMWNVDAGLYFAQGTGGTMKASGYISGNNSLGQPIVEHANYQTDYYVSSQAMINGVKKFDFGPRIATGFVYRHRYTLNAVFQIGARNLAINQGVMDLNYRNLSLDFQIGYIF